MRMSVCFYNVTKICNSHRVVYQFKCMVHIRYRTFDITTKLGFYDFGMSFLLEVPGGI